MRIEIGTPVSDLNARTGRVVARSTNEEDRYLIEWEDGKTRWYNAWITDMLAKNVDD